MRRISAGCAIVLILIAGCGEKNGRKAFGKITETIGQAEMLAVGAAGWTGARCGETVRSGDSLRTKTESALTVEFDGNTVRLGENTTVAVVDSMAGDTNRSIRIFDRCGEVVSDIKHLTKDRESYEVATPTAVSSIRGTHFVVFFAPAAWSTDVKVLDGRVWVVNPLALAPPVIIMPGFFTTIAMRELPVAPAPMNYGQFKKLERSLGSRHYDHYMKQFKMKRNETNMLMPLVPFLPPPMLPPPMPPDRREGKHGGNLPPLPGEMHSRGAPPMIVPPLPLPLPPGPPGVPAPGHHPKEAKKEKGGHRK
jgi:hypothetical protein